MYLEKQLLIKQVGKSKLSTQLKNGEITQQSLQNLAKKEATLLFANPQYQTFSKQLYNGNLLPNLIYQTKVLINMMEVTNLLEPKNPLYQQGVHIKSQLENKFPIEFILHSNHIEGSKIPEPEIRKILEGKKSTYHIPNEIIEVKNSQKARKFLQTDFIRNLTNIKRLYHILTQNLLQETGNAYPKGFKKIPIVVNNEPTTAPEDVETQLKNLVTFIKDKKNGLSPLELAFHFHLKYEQIHPFVNGNGRTGRLLMNKILMQNGMLPMIVFKENKATYFSGIQKGLESTVGLKKYYSFMLEQYAKSIELLISFSTPY